MTEFVLWGAMLGIIISMLTVARQRALRKVKRLSERLAEAQSVRVDHCHFDGRIRPVKPGTWMLAVQGLCPYIDNGHGLRPGRVLVSIQQPGRSKALIEFDMPYATWRQLLKGVDFPGEVGPMLEVGGGTSGFITNCVFEESAERKETND